VLSPTQFGAAPVEIDEEVGTSRYYRVLAFLQGGEDDPTVMDSAGALASRHGARLTALRLWSVPLWAHSSAIVGVFPAKLESEIQAEAMQGLRRMVARVPGDVPVTLLCQRGSPVRVIPELLPGDYECAVVCRRSLSRRLIARLERRRPSLRVVPCAGPPASTVQSPGKGRAGLELGQAGDVPMPSHGTMPAGTTQ
jgi:hypothetical protein